MLNSPLHPTNQEDEDDGRDLRLANMFGPIYVNWALRVNGHGGARSEVKIFG